MPVAEFEEKEYEIAAAIELAGGSNQYGLVFSSGQVLEKILGYDAAADPWSGHRVWAVLGVPRPPGIHLLPSFWLPGVEPSVERLPQHPVSLILQYKRPTYLKGAAAKQWARWQRPYYRFERSKDQQRVLRRFEGATEGEVIVRYASPAFWRHNDLEQNQYMRTVLQASGFVAPSVLGNHRVWTYDRPGTVGYPNPSGRGRIFESIDEMLSSRVLTDQSRALVTIGGPDEHLANLATIALTQEPTLTRSLGTWRSSLQNAAIGLSDQVTQRVVNYIAVQSILARIGAAWYMMEGD
jgi:hypothetical protein